MKHIIASIILTAAAALDLSAAEVVVYSSRTNEMIHVAPIVSKPNEMMRLGTVYSLQCPSMGYRSVIRVSETNGSFAAWVGGDYMPGVPFGCSTGRDDNIIELTDTSVITPRINLHSFQSDRGRTFDEMFSYFERKIIEMRYTSAGEEEELSKIKKFRALKTSSPSLKDGDVVRVRVCRWSVDGIAAFRLYHTLPPDIAGIEQAQRVVVDKYVKYNESAVLTEADIVSSDAPDLDWNYLQDDITIHAEEGFPILTDVTNVCYILVFGDSPHFYMGERDTNVVITTPDIVIERKFSKDPPETRALAPDGDIDITSPKFRFSYAGVNKEEFPAFELEVCSRGTTNRVWASGVKRTLRDVEGNYFYSSQSLENVIDRGSYSWRARLLNSRHKNSPWSDIQPIVFR